MDVYAASTSAIVRTLSVTLNAGSVPLASAYCNCSITPMKACGNHIVSHVGVIQRPSVWPWAAREA
ncbi:hypothetical protein D3C77_817720 [compost metagenome]